MENRIKQIMRYIEKAYYRLFYFFFQIEKRKDGEGKGSDVYCAFMALLPLIYFGFIDLAIMEYLFSRFICNLHVSQFNVTYSLLLVLVSAVFNGVLFFHKKRYLKIREMFSEEDDNTRSIRSFYCILYSLVTIFGSVILIGIFGYPK